MCVKSCPVASPVILKTSVEPDCFEFQLIDEKLLNDSSSGGFFSAVAERVIDDGGVVVGTAWTDNLSVEHILVEDKENLSKLRKSKYLQSSIGFVYREIKSKLE